MTQVFLSCPIACPQSFLEDMAYKLWELLDRSDNFSLQYWRRNTYYSKSMMLDSDIFVLHLPGNQFEYSIYELPSGCRKELECAIEKNMKIFIAYKRSTDGKFGFYPAHVGEYEISASSYGKRLSHLVDEDIEKSTLNSKFNFTDLSGSMNNFELTTSEEYYYLMME